MFYVLTFLTKNPVGIPHKIVNVLLSGYICCRVTDGHTNRKEIGGKK